MSTALEEIEAAIEKLSELRDSAMPGPLEVDTNEPFSSDVVGIFAPEVKAYAIEAIAGSGGGWDEDDEPIDAEGGPHRPTLELLVTLHRTIDAQLTILRDAVAEAFIYVFPDEMTEWATENQGAVGLSRAINGGA